MLTSRRPGHRQRYLRWVGLLSMAVIAIAGIAGIAQWRLSSVQVLSVQSRSMEPLIHKGDAVVVLKQSLATVQAGDIVSYPSTVDPREVITHRVVYVDIANGQMITKGDANMVVDPTADISTLRGGVQSVIPRAGVVVDMLHSWRGLTVLVYIPAALVLAQEMSRVVRYYGRPTYRLAKL